MSDKPIHLKVFDLLKIRLMGTANTVFYTTILWSLKHVWVKEDDAEIPTAAVDGLTLWINPKFFMGLSEPERIGLIIHEILHVALNHMCRLGNKIPLIWNYACDYVINLMLKDAGYTIPACGLYDEQYRDMSAEQVYKLIYKKAKEDLKKFGGILGDNLGVNGTGIDIRFPDSADTKGLNDKIVDILIRAKIQSEAGGDAAGTIPGSVLMELEERINPKLPWEQLYMNEMDSFCKDDYSMHRPNRRFAPRYYMPVCHSEAINDLVMAVDASCSVTIPQFSHFVGEIATVQERLKPEKITLITFDTNIKHIDEITQDTNVLKDISFTGRGGTDLHPLFKWLDEHQPKVCTIFTDGGFRTPPEPKSTSIIWLIHNNENWNDASYGRIIHYTIPR